MRLLFFAPIVALELAEHVAAQGMMRNCTVDADCESFVGDETCVALPTAGTAAKYCVPTSAPQGAPQRCSSGSPVPVACCNSSACSDAHGNHGTCSARISCGGPPPLPGGGQNQCFFDDCVLSPDLVSRLFVRAEPWLDARVPRQRRRAEEATLACKQGEVCVPAGFGDLRGYPRNFCAPAGCSSDTDCSDPKMTGGACTAFLSSFRCGAAAFDGFYCSYDQSACRIDKDCSSSGGALPGAGKICVYNSTAAAPQCQQPMPPPPLVVQTGRYVES